MAENEDKREELDLDEEAQWRLLSGAEMVRHGAVVTVLIGDKKWKIRPTSMAQNEKMTAIDFDVREWQRQLKDATSSKHAKRLHGKIRKAYAKKAAHKVLGSRLRWLPFAYALMWRRIYHASEAVSATINSTESIGENKVFYLANLGSSKQALVRCMTQVGDGVKQAIARMESAENMVAADGLPKKAASKSETSLKRPRITKG